MRRDGRGVLRCAATPPLRPSPDAHPPQTSVQQAATTSPHRQRRWSPSLFLPGQVRRVGAPHLRPSPPLQHRWDFGVRSRSPRQRCWSPSLFVPRQVRRVGAPHLRPPPPLQHRWDFGVRSRPLKVNPRCGSRIPTAGERSPVAQRPVAWWLVASIERLVRVTSAGNWRELYYLDCVHSLYFGLVAWR